MIIALAFGALLQQQQTLPPPPLPRATGSVLDATTGAPVSVAQITAPSGVVRSRLDGWFSVVATPGDTLRVRRIGYRETSVVVGDEHLIVRLNPAATALETMRITDSVVPGRMTSTSTVAQLREQGALSAGAAVAAMPFVTARGARGETTVSLRGARPEQVMVTLDGMPLNDPATGRADFSDIPLSALGAVSVAPGSDASTYGSGTSGGVITLVSSDESVLTAGATSLSSIMGEGAFVKHPLGHRVRLGAAVSSARNNFLFLNDAGTSDTIERRVNADELRAAVFVTAIAGQAQVTLLYTTLERGMAGAENVRAYDRARERSERRLARVRVGGDRWLAGVGVRRLALRYWDKAFPELDDNAFGTTVEADLQTSFSGVTWRTGVAQEHTWGNSLPEADRPSAFASAAAQRTIARALMNVSVRFDAVRGAGGHLSPAIAIERPGRIRPFVRLSQGFRLPTFYDLYAPSPLGFVATRVRPERVVLDGEIGARITGFGATASLSAFERRTRDAVIWFPGNFSWSPKNVAREHVRGIEARASAGSRSLSADWWAATYDTRLFTEGISVPTPYVPRLTGGASARIEIDRFILVPAITARGRRPFAIAPSSRLVEMPGVVFGDLTLTYRVPGRLRESLLTTGVHNIANAASESVRRFPSPGRTWHAAITVHP